MDEIIGGVIIGSALTIIGGFVQFLLTWAKEFLQRRNDERLARERWERDARKEERLVLREIYQNALLHLSMIPRSKPEPESTSALQFAETSIHEATRWVALLALRHPANEFQSLVRYFIDLPYDSANSLRDDVLAMAAAEDLFAAPSTTRKSTPRKVRAAHELHVAISPEHRKRRLVQGVELRAEVVIPYSLSKLTRSQRQKLVELHGRNGDLPGLVRLTLPGFHPGRKRIQSMHVWNAEVDGKNLAQTLTAWEEAYVVAMNEATAMKEAALSPKPSI